MASRLLWEQDILKVQILSRRLETAAVAQLAEQGFCKAQVEGSSPSSSFCILLKTDGVIN